jgi:hypothetical protein
LTSTSRKIGLSTPAWSTPKAFRVLKIRTELSPTYASVSDHAHVRPKSVPVKVRNVWHLIFLPPSSLNSSLLYAQRRLGSACRLIHRSHLIRHLPRYIWNLPITKPRTSWALKTSYLAASLDDSPGHTVLVHHWDFKSCPWARSASDSAPQLNERLPSRLADHREGGAPILVRHCVLINAH